MFSLNYSDLYFLNFYFLDFANLIFFWHILLPAAIHVITIETLLHMFCEHIITEKITLVIEEIYEIKAILLAVRSLVFY